jgi:hypothetical protein
MKTLEFGKPIELTEAQGRLIDLISRGEWGRIAPDVLRSLVRDVRRLRRFLDQNALSDTDEAKVVLKQFGPSAEDRDIESGSCRESVFVEGIQVAERLVLETCCGDSKESHRQDETS